MDKKKAGLLVGVVAGLVAASVVIYKNRDVIGAYFKVVERHPLVKALKGYIPAKLDIP